MCAFLYFIGVCQRRAPAVDLPLPQGSPNVRADVTVQLSPPDARGESGGRSRSRGWRGEIGSARIFRIIPFCCARGHRQGLTQLGIE